MDLRAGLARLFRSPADRRLAAAAAAELAAPALPPAAPGMPPRVALVPGSGPGAAERQRAWLDEQRQGIRTPWVPTQLHWRFEDLEDVWQNAEIGNLDPLARMVEAFRSEGVTEGLVDVGLSFIRKPITFQGDPWLCSLLRGEPPIVSRGRVVKPGKKGLFRRICPVPALRDLARTGRLAGVAAAELVDDPVTGFPVMQTRDLHRVRYDWGERCWKYRGNLNEYLIEPGNGRWILYCPDATHRPWRAGRWLPLSLAFVVMVTTAFDAARFQARSADPLKYIEVGDEVPPDEVDKLEEFVQLWWERNPGIVLRYGAKAGIVEPNSGTAYTIYKQQREWAAQQINFTLRGSMGTSGEGAGIFSDPTASLEVADELIQAQADALAECLAEQVIGPTFERFGFVRHRDDAPTCAWDTRSPARRLAEAKAAGEIADNVLKINAALLADGQRVNAPAYFVQCGVSLPTVPITTELLDADGNALWTGEAEVVPEGPLGLLPEAGTVDPVVDQTTPAGSLE
jgi:hypothetical protein